MVNMAKLIIGLAGEIAAGKTFSTRYLADQYQAETFRFSTPLRDIASRLYLPETRENLAKMSLALRQTFGEELFSRVIAHDAERAKADLVVIDGVRRLPDIAALKSLPQFCFVYLEAEPKIRHSRLVVRGENHDDNSKTWEQFQQDHQLETEQQIRQLKESADVVITNDGDKAQLFQALDDLVQKRRG